MIAQLGLALAFALTLAQGSPAPQTAADSVLEARTREVASVLRCPVCQGLSIQDSPSPLAQEMKGLVRDQLRAGRSPEEVKAYFVGRYGEWILLQPKASGFNLAVYVLPVVMLLGGVVLIAVLARKWSRKTLSEPVPVHAGAEPPNP
jgi:cytochrome c-type biogenesis protein CcmH